MGEPLDDLLARMCSGNTAAAAELFLAFEPYLRKAVRRQMPAPLRAKFDSADVLQSVWADVLRGFHQAGWRFTDVDHLRGFLYAATRNRLIDRVRQHNRAAGREEPLADGGFNHALPSPTPRPSELARAGMALAVFVAAGAVAAGAAGHVVLRTEQARTALADGRSRMERGEWEGAAQTLAHGLSAARSVPFQGRLADDLGRSLETAERARAAADRAALARELHRLARLTRALEGTGPLPPERLSTISAGCRALWDHRDGLAARLDPARDDTLGRAARDDLLDLAVLRAALELRREPPAAMAEARRTARAVLAQAEALLNPGPTPDAGRTARGAAARH